MLRLVEYFMLRERDSADFTFVWGVASSCWDLGVSPTRGSDFYLQVGQEIASEELVLETFKVLSSRLQQATG